MRRFMLAIAALFFVTGCAVKPEISRTDAEVQAAAYVHGGQPELTLFTSINNRNESGAHTALMVNASQRVIFDPAGSFRGEKVIRRGDVIFGATPAMAQGFTRFQASETFRVRVQTLPVSPETAEAVLRSVIAAGRQGDARCAASTSAILGRYLPQANIAQTWFPKNLADQFAQIPGVSERVLKVYETGVLADYDPALLATQ